MKEESSLGQKKIDPAITDNELQHLLTNYSDWMNIINCLLSYIFCLALSESKTFIAHRNISDYFSYMKNKGRFA